MKKKLQSSFDRASKNYDVYSNIQKLSGNYLFENFDMLSIQPKHILDLGCGTGFLTPLIQKKFPSAKIDMLDFSFSMLELARNKNKPNFINRLLRRPINYICADAHQMPFKNNQYELIISNLMLQWCDLKVVFQECRRILKTGGLFIFSTFGPGTLKEMQHIYHKVLNDDQVIVDFIDMHDIGDLLMKVGLHDCVVSAQAVTEHFSSPKEAFYSVKNVGSQREKATWMMTSSVWKKLQKAYAQFLSFDQKYPASYELIFGHAWRLDKNQKTHQAVQIDSIQ